MATYTYGPAGAASAQGSTSSSTASTNDADANGRRVRLRPKPAASNQIYGPAGKGLLSPLRATNGIVFPYQPTINYTQDVVYNNIDLVHVNQELLAYTRTAATKLAVSGQFTAQNQTEGTYALACIHFLRTVTKMWFGQGANIGTPPPVLLFDAFGQYMFNQLPVLVTNFTINMPNDVDYLPVDVDNPGSIDINNLQGMFGRGLPTVSNGQTVIPDPSLISKPFNDLTARNYVWVPVLFNIDISLTVQNTPYRLRQFDLDKFRTGDLMKKEGKWI